MLEKQRKRITRHKRVRGKVFGDSQKLRLSVFRSNKHIYAQLINDEKGKTMLSANDKEIKEKVKTRTDMAKEVGKLIAKKALSEKIEKVAFDKGGYLYHGQVKALADGAREGGLKF